MTDTDLINARACPECERLRLELDASNNRREELRHMINRKENDLHVATERAEKAEKACAEMTEVLRMCRDKIANLHDSQCDSIQSARRRWGRIEPCSCGCSTRTGQIAHALSTDCGKEYVHRKYLEEEQRISESAVIRAERAEKACAELTDRAEKAEKAAVKMRDYISSVVYYSGDYDLPQWMRDDGNDLLTTDCGTEYVHRSEVDALKAKIHDLEVQLIGADYAAGLLRMGMGLTEGTDLHECLETFKALKEAK